MAIANATFEISAPATDLGVLALVEEAEAIRDKWFGTTTMVSPKAPAPVKQVHDVVKLHSRLHANSRSREALELLPGDIAHGVTPEELGALMRPDKNGNPVSKASARAAIRVLQRVTGGLAKKGALTGEIVQIDWRKYEVEKAARYYISAEARKALDAHLGA